MDWRAAGGLVAARPGTGALPGTGGGPPMERRLADARPTIHRSSRRGRGEPSDPGASPGTQLWRRPADVAQPRTDRGAAGPRQTHHDNKPCATEGVRRQVSWWGFCTIRSLTTACRRRVAALMVQFPPFGGGVIGKQAAPGPARALWPFRRASYLWRWGFCSIRSLASACRRRVAALMVQFPPFGDALHVGRARPCASHSAIPSVWWR